MASYKRPTNEQEFEQNFAAEYPLMNDTQAYYESSRCLFCYDAPCIKACPTEIDIPLFIRQINAGNNIGAAQTIYDANYMGNACGKVCPTKVLCEGACVFNHSDVPPIDIGRLQNYATNKAIEAGKTWFKPGADNGKKVAIIGAGPASIACACELRQMGYQVDIFEAKDHPSGLTVYGTAPYKITNEEVLDEVKWLQEQLNFTIHYQKPITSQADLDQLASDYGAIFIGIGLGKTRALHIPGTDKVNCIGAVEFVEQLRMNHHSTEVGKQVVVLGGGNTAMDAASEAARMGADQVTLAYRRDQAAMGAYYFEFDLAKKAGVTGLFNVSPIAILGDDKVEGVQFIRTENKDGKLQTIEGSEFTIPCDMVLLATGQEKQKSFLSQIEGLALDAKGRIQVNISNYQTGNPQFFAGGDCVNGGAEVVNAAYEGKMAAKGINQYLTQ